MSSTNLDVSVIPMGIYCHGKIEEHDAGQLLAKPCPYWSIDESKPAQNNGYCKYLKLGDWELNGFPLLWDQVKECGINDDIVEE